MPAAAFKPIQQSKKERNPESPTAWFAPMQIPQTDTPLPLTLALPSSTPADVGSGTSITAADRIASRLTPTEAGIPIMSISTPETVLEKGSTIPTTQGPGLTLEAPIAFALKLNEITQAQAHAPSTLQGPAPIGRPVAPTYEIDGRTALALPEPAQVLPASVPIMKPKGQCEPVADNLTPAEQPAITVTPTAATLQSSLNPTQPPVVQAASETTVAAPTAADKPPLYVNQLANTKEESRKQAPVPDGGLSASGSPKQPETFSIPFTQPADGSRPAPDLVKDTNPRPVTMADAQPVQTQGTSAADGSNLPHPTAAREISIRLTPVESPTVDIKLVDRAGSLHVAVRTPDADLAQTLQSGLSDLVHRLERRGFEAETWSPKDGASPLATQSSQANNNGSPSQQSKDSRDERQQGNPQQNNGRNRPKWVTELEQRLDNEAEA